MKTVLSSKENGQTFRWFMKCFINLLKFWLSLSIYLIETIWDTFTIWFHFYNFKNVKNTHRGRILLVKLQTCNFTNKSNTLPWVFFTFLKMCEWYQIAESVLFPRLCGLSSEKYLNEEKEDLEALCEKCPNSGFFRSVFSPNAAKYGPEKLRIWILFTQWKLQKGNSDKVTLLHLIINLMIYIYNWISGWEMKNCKVKMNWNWS